MILVTGGAGFIGRHVVQALLARGRACRVLDLQPWAEAPAAVEVMQASIRNETAVRHALRDVEGVIHLAAISTLWLRQPRHFFEINAEAAGALAQQAKAAGAKRFVYVSSHTTLISGPPSLESQRLSERSDPAPEVLLGPYPRAKQAGERLALAQAEVGFGVISAIPTLPAGPGDISLTEPTKLLLDLAARKLPAILETSMNFVDVRDLARSLIEALDRGRSGERYLLGGEDWQLSEVALAVARRAGKRPVRRRAPYNAAIATAYVQAALSKLTGGPPQAPLTGVKIAGRRVRFNSQKAIEELGHRVRPFDETLVDLIAWARETGHLKALRGKR